MGIPLRLLGLAAVTLIGATCAFPTDDSAKVFVSVVSLDTTMVVRRGAKLELYARMYHASGADTVEIQNVRFLWTTDDDDIATVEAGGLGSAEVTGVNSGVVNVTARAVAFEQAQSDQFAVRVSNAVEIDSIRPEIVRFGDTITVYGVGVDSILIAFLENATLFDYPVPGLVATRTRDSLGFGTAVFWVPPPSRSAQLSFIGPGVFGSAADSTRVFPVDALEPNETAPRSINLDAPPRFPALPFLRFFNPALAFEIPKRDETGVEWYRFAQASPRDVTLILSGPEVRGTFQTFLTDSLAFEPSDSSYRLGLTSWTIGPGSHNCRGVPFEPPQTQPESTVVALGGMPAGAIHALAFYGQPGRYGLAVVEGYVVSNPAFPRDDREEDDFCNRADPPTRIVAVGFRDTLTIDNPHDVDWIRLTVPSLQSVRFRIASLVSATVDSSDVDLFVLRVSDLSLVTRADLIGSDEDVTVLLAAGDYYVVLVDYIGVPTRYQICINCPGAFPAPALADVRRPVTKGTAPPFRAPGGGLRSTRP